MRVYEINKFYVKNTPNAEENFQRALNLSNQGDDVSTLSADFF